MDTGKKIPVILDGDPGHDDAIAWTVAKASNRLDIRAVTTVGGNQTVEKTTYNARRICALLGIDAPIAKGNAFPLMSKPMTAGNFHGTSGLDGPKLPEPDRPLSGYTAVELMAKVLRESEDPVTIFSTGAQTNVAALLLTHPELKEKIGCISIMGGGIQYGNWTPAAEFNILVDPEAAQTVFQSGVPVQMCGLDVTEKALVMPEDFETIRNIGNQVSRIVAEWLDFFMIIHKEMGYEGAPLHDPNAILSYLYPEIYDIREMHVEVETAGLYTRGCTVGNYGKIANLGVLEQPNVRVVMNVDRGKFVEKLVEAVKKYDGREVKI
ncbi:MAG: nucleoside hydrolase [Erysipelotrichales bacterium]|nr:nucleoside hydrolase [Erysipelotrichales bacterium]MBQ4011150.1 nucleoside hydrolase [Erysipelotrichales bacterium]MBQ4374376.1 nucleoside hydrolase [Erysipelotrichales bacterium]